jgi:hypothetical protein
MRERDRTNFGKNKKQIKTKTLYLTLFVTAMFFISSAVTAISLSSDSRQMNENFDIITTKTLSDPNGQSGNEVSLFHQVASNRQHQSRDIWDLAFHYDVGGESGSLYLVGLGFDGTYFYCPQFQAGTIHKFEMDGTYIGSFTMPVSNILDLTYNPDTGYFYGAPQSPSNNIYVLDFENEEVVDTITAPAAAWNIAYTPDADNGNGGFYIGQWSYHLKLIDMDGNELDDLPVPESMFGIGYDNTFEYEGYDGPFLWISTGTSTGMDCVIKCIDLNTQTLIPDFEFNVADDLDPGMAGGLELTYLWDPAVSVLTGLSQGVGDDYAYGYEISNLVPPEHDVGVKKFLHPVDGPAEEFITPKVLVKNFGNNSETTDVQFEIIKCEAGPPLLDENFSGTFPPDGWETDIWKKVGTPGTGGNAGGEAPEARAYKYDYDDPYYMYIQCPPTNCTGFEKINIKFHMAVDIYDPYYTNHVYFHMKYRKNETSNWKDLSPWDKPFNEDMPPTYWETGCYGWGEDIGEAFQVRFEMTSSYYYYWYVWLDNFHIEGCAGCAEYSDLAKDQEIPWDSEVEVEFEPWTPSEWHNPDFQDTWEEYPLTSYTTMEDDNSRNDRKIKLLSLWYPWLHDVGCLGTEGPETGPAQVFPVVGNIKNVGQYPECCFKTYAEIAEIDFGSQEEVFTANFGPSCYPWPPSGWTRDPSNKNNWRCSYTSYAGGSYPEARFYWYPSSQDVFRLYTPPMDTSDFGAVKIEFKHELNHFGGPYTIKCETSQDGISWTTVWEVENPSNIPDETVTIITGENVGNDEFYVSMTYDGNSYNCNYWYVDDLVVNGFPLAEAEYSEFKCIADIDNGEQIDLEFDDWEPDFLSEMKTGTRQYAFNMWTDMEGDNNLANDAFKQFLKLDFFHDVGIQGVESPTDIDPIDVEWYQYHDDHTESAWRWTAGNPWQVAIQLTDEFGLDDYRGWDITEVKFSCGDDVYGWCNADSEIWISDELEDPNDPPEIYGSGQSSGSGWDIVELDDAYKIPSSGDVYLGISYSNYDSYPGGVDHDNYEPEGFWWYYNGWLDAAGYLGQAVWGLSAGVTQGGAPGIEAYITPGSQDIDVIVENIGTFPEVDMVCTAVINEYVTNCTQGTLVYEDMKENIDIEEPLGGTETLRFDDYTFVDEGVYGLFLNLSLALVDDVEIDLKNNMLAYGIGVDDTAPTTTYTLNPPDPDGLRDWYISDVEVSVTATDPSIGCEREGSGVDYIAYEIDGVPGQISGSSGIFTITEDGDDVLVEYWAVDNVGNAESRKSFTIDMDQTIPEIDLTYEWEGTSPPWTFHFIVNATDATSGMERVEYYLNEGLEKIITGPGPEYIFSLLYVPPPYALWTAIAYDMAGLENSDFVENPDQTTNVKTGSSSSEVGKIIRVPQRI